ncbi:MAG: ATP-binding protein [Lachnospiraceae bacterium]|nr:ATP-binding protein [Lachnospiraceae bacterium]
MTLLPWIEINNFRGISHLQYEPKQVNLLIGRNNSGKSTILEAIYAVLMGKEVPTIFNQGRYLNRYGINVHAERASISADNHDFFISCSLSDLPADFSEKIVEKLNLVLFHNAKFTPSPFYQKKFIDYLIKSRMVSFSVLDGNLRSIDVTPYKGFSEKLAADSQSIFAGADISPEDLQEYLYQFCRMSYGFSENVDANVGNIRFINNSDKLFYQVTADPLELIELDKFVLEHNLLPNVERLMEDGVVYRENDETYFLPYTVHGTGFSILLNLISTIRQCRDGVLLIEEPENHMHPGYLQVFVENLMLLARKLNVQVFLTTHSYDLIEAFANYSQYDEEESVEERDLIQITRIVKRRDEHELYNYTPSEAFAEMVEMKMDLRGT